MNYSWVNGNIEGKELTPCLMPNMRFERDGRVACLKKLFKR